MPPTFILSQDQTLQFNVYINLRNEWRLASTEVEHDSVRTQVKEPFEVFDGFTKFGDYRQPFAPVAYASGPQNYLATLAI